jgi:hypothetical protein
LAIIGKITRIIFSKIFLKNGSPEFFTFTPRRNQDDMPGPHGLFMASTLIRKDTQASPDPRALQLVRQKYREVFGCEAPLNDDALARRYRVTGDGDLIMILR